MSYIRFSLMILTSTIVMFIFMYLNTYAFEHLFFSETRAYMAVVMGAVMAFIMLAFMLGMYSNKKLNIAIFLGSIVVFALSLWLVRSQVTVSGPSYMRAMIPHHSIAVMTSERAQIRDARVRSLADEIISAQRREIAEMRYLIADVTNGNVVQDIYEDPAAEPGSIQDALNNTLISTLSPSPLSQEEAAEVLDTSATCRFNRSPETDPILWASTNGAAMKLNGVLIALDGSTDSNTGLGTYTTDGASITVRDLPEGEDDWRQDAELTFDLEEGRKGGYRGFWACDA